VQSASSVDVTITANITFDIGYSWSNLQTSIDGTISGYLLELRKAWASASTTIVRISQIESRLLDITGIIDIDSTMINGMAQNLTLGEYEIPVFGGASE
jgi:hypothetical protein